MSGSSSKAISFANSYCTLADGLVPGLEDCLAENVVLDWFGKTIKSRSNVAAFMNVHKVNSRHVFNNISSASSIGYNRRPNRARARRRSKNTSKFPSNGNITIELRPSCESTPKTPVNEIISNADRSRSSLKKSAEGNNVEEADITFELNDDDVSKMFKLEKIQSTNIEEIERKINQISLDDRLKLVSPRKRDIKEVNDNANEGSSMNYIEAHGEILFSKKSRRLSGWGEKKIVSSSITHTWRKPCKLQVAYTSHPVLVHTSSTNGNKSSPESSPEQITFQKSFDFADVSDTNNLIASNGNSFKITNLDKEEEKDFFKNFDEHLSKNEANKLGLVPRYANDHLVFQRKDCDNYDIQNNFVFNHTIHVIIYEGRSRCRINLSQKFT